MGSPTKAIRLERSSIVRKALELLKQTGLDGLTTRRLAEALGVQSPALYWYFKSKQELIDEMARTMIADAHESLREDQEWTAWLRDWARRIRAVMLSYRDGARVFTGFRPRGPHGRMDPDLFLAPLRSAGFSRLEAVSALIVVARFTFGWTVDEQAAADRVEASPACPPLDPDGLFEFGLGTIIDGLKAHLARVHEPSTSA